jgi:APA family basic amino acid/polyamine antiporter
VPFDTGIGVKGKKMANNRGKLGLLHSSTMIIGGMFGSAIFSLSGVTIMNAGPASILSWIIAGIILFFYGLLNAELSTVFPRSGGVFVFPAKTLGKTPEQGRLWGWIASWGYLSGAWVGTSFAAVYVGSYLSQAFPALLYLRVPLALLAIFLCGFLNAFNISVAGRVSAILTGSLILTMLVYVGVSFFGGAWDSSLLHPFFTQGKQGPFGFILSVPIAMVAYGSIVSAAFMVGEIKNPNKTIPRAMMIAMSVVMSLYFLILLATLGLVRADFLRSDPNMAMIPLYAAARTKLMNLPWLPVLLSLAATIALLSNMMVLTALAARVVQAAAISGILPRILGENNRKTGAPLRAVVLVTLCFSALAAFPDVTLFAINLSAMCNAAVVSIICITVIKARKKFPGQAAFNAPGGKITPVIMMIVLLSCYVPQFFMGGWYIWVFTASYMLCGVLIFFSSAKKRRKAETESMDSLHE